MHRRLLGLAVPVLALVLSSCGSSDTTAGQASGATDTSSAEAGTTTEASSSETTTSIEPSSGSAAAGSCTYVSDGQQPARAVNPPSSTPTYTGKVPALISTTAGDLHVTLDGDTAPCTVNSFASLAQQGFFDNTPCPRITTEVHFQLLQCGDPTGSGAGGPGYRFADELSGHETYPAGTLAMANGGPGTETNGSQFFIVYGDTTLQPAYTVFGTVATADLNGIAQIGAQGSDGSNPAGGGKPATPITITKVTVGQ